MKTFQQSIEWLKSKKILNRYYRNFHSRPISNKIKNVSDLFLLRGGLDLISGGFFWDDSIEGYGFWYRIYNEYTDWWKS